MAPTIFTLKSRKSNKVFRELSDDKSKKHKKSKYPLTFKIQRLYILRSFKGNSKRSGIRFLSKKKIMKDIDYLMSSGVYASTNQITHPSLSAYKFQIPFRNISKKLSYKASFKDRSRHEFTSN